MYKSGKSSKSRRWGAWTEWIWSDQYSRYYRQRQDDCGEVETEWHDGTTGDDQTPRDTGIEDLTQGIANLRAPSSTNYNDYNAEYEVSSGSRAKSSKSKPSSRHKGKERSYAEDDDEDTEREEPVQSSKYAPQANSAPSKAPQWDSSAHSTSKPNAAVYDPRTGQYYSTDPTYAQQAETSYDYPATSTKQPIYQTQDTSYTRMDEDDELQAAIARSRGYNQSAYTVGEPSGAAYGPYEHEVEGPPAPRRNSGYGSASNDYLEQLDPRYRVEPSSRFQPGEIFKVHWSEPQGSGNEGAVSISERHELRDKFGGKFFVGFRRFIVIANDQGHCTCVPILTYGGKGCKKKGVKPEKHGIIYEKGSKARLLSNEPKLGFAPAKVEITAEGEKLSKESRVNYSKLVTIEHNVKVFFIGTITASDWDIVSEAVNRCWESKNHHKRKHFK